MAPPPATLVTTLGTVQIRRLLDVIASGGSIGAGSLAGDSRLQQFLRSLGGVVSSTGNVEVSSSQLRAAQGILEGQLANPVTPEFASPTPATTEPPPPVVGASAISLASSFANPTSPVRDAFAASSLGGAPVATGFELLRANFDMLLAADAARRATTDQRVSIASFLTELARTSPSRAADFRFFGSGGEFGAGPGDEFSFINALTRGDVPGIFGTGVSGNIGGTNVTTPGVLGLKQLDFLQNNPNIAAVLGDVAERLGDPDIFTRSIGASLPVSRRISTAAGV